MYLFLRFISPIVKNDLLATKKLQLDQLYFILLYMKNK